MNVTKYNAKDCVITVNDVYITGLGEDMVTGAKDEEFTSPTVGAMGDVVVNAINNSLGTITLTVQATCPQKAMLINLARSHAIFPIWVTCKSTGERMGGTQASIKNFPEFAFGAEAEDREFEIQVYDYDVLPTE